MWPKPISWHRVSKGSAVEQPLQVRLPITKFRIISNNKKLYPAADVTEQTDLSVQVPPHKNEVNRVVSLKKNKIKLLNKLN